MLLGRVWAQPAGSPKLCASGLPTCFLWAQRVPTCHHLNRHTDLCSGHGSLAELSHSARPSYVRLTVGAGPACEHFPAQSEPGSCGAEGPGGGASAPAPFHPPSSPPCQHCAVSENERCQTQAQGKRHICPRNTNASKGGGRGERFQKENVPGKCLNPESLLHRRVSAPKTQRGQAEHAAHGPACDTSDEGNDP